MGLAEITKPLYASTRGPQPVGCTETEQRTFEVLKKSLALGATCCSYASQSVAIRENLAMVRKTSKKAKKGGINEIISVSLYFPDPIADHLTISISWHLIPILIGLMVRPCFLN